MNGPVRAVIALLLSLVAGFLLLACLGYSSDQIGGARPAGSNLMGFAGAGIAYGLLLAWGMAAFLVPAIVFGYAVAVWRRYDLAHLPRRLTGAILLIPAMAGLVHLLPVGPTNPILGHWNHVDLGGLGGSVGYFLCGPSAAVRPDAGCLVQWLGVAGAATTLAAVAVAGIWMMRLGLARYVRRLSSAIRSWREQPESDTATPISSEPFVPPLRPPQARRNTTSINEIAKRLSGEQPGLPEDAMQLVERIRLHRKALEKPGEIADTPAPPPAAEATGSATARAAAEPVANQAADAPAPQTPASTQPAASEASQPPPATPAAAAQPVAPVANAGSAKAQASARRPGTRGVADGEHAGYVLPGFDLLDRTPEKREAEHESEKAHISASIEEVFSHFDIAVKVVNSTRGPVVTQYEIKLMDQGLRVNKVEGFEKDLSLKLGTEGIRIVAPLPNKNTIGIEVPNRVKAAVVMRELVEEIDPAKMMLPVVLGRDVVGKPMVADLAKMPHLLVAGATGMGKSVCMNAMICSILLFRTPEEVKFIMVDPKMVELAGYEDIPHLLTPPITDMTKAHAALEWACATMDERYEALKAAGVRDIASFNALGDTELRFRLAKKEIKLEDLSHPSAFMPYIIILVDEYADLMMVNKEVEKSIVRLAAKSRACGIHVILTTQRPSADVVTGLIKSNLPSRICFRVVDKSNSRVVLDTSGAENLLGKGDLLFLQPGTSMPVRGQGVWLKDSEINAIVEHAKGQDRPTYDENVLKVGAVAQAGGGSGDGPGGEWVADREFHGAVQAMYRYNRTGADFFRRKCNVGYNRATTFVEILEDLGFLSPQKGTAPREILKTWDDWMALLKENSVTWEEGDDIYTNPTELKA